MQSTYRKHLSTDTILLLVINDVVLVLLDSAAAFDTTDHMILLVERIESYFAFSKLTLNWFISYLENQRESIIIGDQVSTPALCVMVSNKGLCLDLYFSPSMFMHTTLNCI